MLLALLALAGCARQGGPAPVVMGGGNVAPSAAPMSPSTSAPMLAPMSAPMSTAASRPMPAGPLTTLTVYRGDTLYGIARQTGAPLRTLIDTNHLQPPYQLQAGQRLSIPPVTRVIAQPGDTIESIAARYGVGSSDLARRNGLQPPYAVSPGQTLNLPIAGGAGMAVASAAPAPVTVSQAPAASPVPAPAGGAAAVDSTIPPGATVTTVSSAPGYVPQAASPPVPAPPPGMAPQAGAATRTASLTPPPAPPTSSPAPAPQSAPPADQAVLSAPPARAGGRFLWPVRGHILSDFGNKPDGSQNDGINIAAPEGTPVLAADNGVVAYAGNELRGFGNLLLIRHADGWVTAYAHLEKILVQRGATVTRGEKIGLVGASGGVGTPQLHFEIRKGSTPVNPAGELAPAAS